MLDYFSGHEGVINDPDTPQRVLAKSDLASMGVIRGPSLFRGETLSSKVKQGEIVTNHGFIFHAVEKELHCES